MSHLADTAEKKLNLDAFNPDVIPMFAQIDKLFNGGHIEGLPFLRAAQHLFQYTKGLEAGSYMLANWLPALAPSAAHFASIAAPAFGPLVFGANVGWWGYEALRRKQVEWKKNGFKGRARVAGGFLKVLGAPYHAGFKILDGIGNLILGNSKTAVEMAKQNISGIGGGIMKSIETGVGLFDKVSHLFDPSMSPQLAAARKQDNGDGKEKK